MTSPQLENGYTKIANEILEALATINLSSYQSRLLWVVLRKTYGFNKKYDWISNSQIIVATGLKKGHVSRTKKELIQRRIQVTSSGNKIAFNKNYKQWRELPKKVTVTSTGTPVTNTGTKVTSRGGHKRNYTKKTSTKDIKKLKQKENPIWKKFCDLCEEFELENAVSPALYLKTVSEYSQRGAVSPEIRNCLYWCKDNDKRKVSIMRVRNWLKTWAANLKKKEIQQEAYYQDKKFEEKEKQFTKPKPEKLWTPPNQSNRPVS